MDTQTRILIGAILCLSLVAAGIYLAPTINEKVFQPQVVRALVAIEVADSGIADVGVVSIEAGTTFTLHAILEATRRSGGSVYYTRAPGLRFLDAAGKPGEPVPASSIQPWDRRGLVKVRWFTIEGRQPVLRLEPGQGLDMLKFEPYFRADWPTSWSVPGFVEPAFDDRLNLGSRLTPGETDFGTQRYYVRVELYQDEKQVLASERFASPGPEELLADPATFSTVVASIAGAAGPASRVFGLTQIELPAEAPPALRDEIGELVDQRLAFTGLSVLWEQMRTDEGTGPSGAGDSNVADADAADVDAGDPDSMGARREWQDIDLSATPAWGQAVARGDLLRVGGRVVVLYADRGVTGVLDYEDLCFDFVGGATVRALGDVFSGEDSFLEHLPLGR